jgi:hypothetical protein
MRRGRGVIPATISALIGLRAALDRALKALAPLSPVLAAWAASSPAEASGAVAAPPRPRRGPSNGAKAPERPPREPHEASCAECGATFVRHGRQRYCSPRCRGRAGDRRRRGEREVATEPVPDQIERPLHVPEFERSLDTSALLPPALPWESDEERH